MYIYKVAGTLHLPDVVQVNPLKLLSFPVGRSKIKPLSKLGMLGCRCVVLWIGR